MSLWYNVRSKTFFKSFGASLCILAYACFIEPLHKNALASKHFCLRYNRSQQNFFQNPTKLLYRKIVF